MSNSYIQVATDGSGKKMQTYLNTIGVDDVHAEAVVLVDNTGNYISTLPVSISSNINISNVTVTGTVTAIQSNASNFLSTVSGVVTANQTNASNFLSTVSGTVTATQSNASNFLATITGTVTANAGTNLNTSLLATDATQTSGAQKTQIVDGSGNVIASSSNALNVAVQNASIAVTGTIATNEAPDATSTYAPSNATSSAYETNRVIKGSAGVLFAITGYNSGGDQFIQIHNSAALPSDTAVPVITFFVRTLRNFSLSFGGKFGRFFSTGIVICNSSTGPTKTIGSADCWFDAQYK